MENLSNFMKRYLVWLIIFSLAIIYLLPSIAEIKTLLLIITSECMAIMLSGLALYVYTKIDFITEYYHGEINENSSIIGSVFLGVHILIGLVILGVYIAQFTN